jgi:hypothetical protein
MNTDWMYLRRGVAEGNMWTQKREELTEGKKKTAKSKINYTFRQT